VQSRILSFLLNRQEGSIDTPTRKALVEEKAHPASQLSYGVYLRTLRFFSIKDGVTYYPVEVPSLSIPPESKVQVKACFELDPLVYSPVKMPSQEQGGEGAKKKVTELPQILRQRRHLQRAAGGAGAEAGHSNSATVTVRLLELDNTPPAALVAHAQI
jgi:hypothetical protein